MTDAIYRWPPAALRGDYLRSGLGFGVSLFFLLLMPPLSLPFVALLALTVIFGIFLAQTALRARTTYVLLPEGLGVAGFFGRSILRWDELDRFALRYYTLRRDKEAGWLDLKLRSGGQSITIDDRLEGFHAILSRAWQAARARDLGISAATYANLAAAGIVDKSSVPK